MEAIGDGILLETCKPAFSYRLCECHLDKAYKSIFKKAKNCFGDKKCFICIFSIINTSFRYDFFLHIGINFKYKPWLTLS